MRGRVLRAEIERPEIFFLRRLLGNRLDSLNRHLLTPPNKVQIRCQDPFRHIASHKDPLQRGETGPDTFFDLF